MYGSFDAVIAGWHMLYHVEDPAKGITEMHRVLKPDGFLAVTTNGIGNMRKMYELATVFGSPPHDPAAAAFGYDTAERLMQAQFGNVACRTIRRAFASPSRKMCSWRSRPIRPATKPRRPSLSDCAGRLPRPFRTAMAC